MDQEQFRQELMDEGFDAPRTVRWEASTVNQEHSHDFTARGLVIAGQLRLSANGDERTYDVGDTFELAARVPHVERVGPKGVELLIGRRRA